MKLFNLRTDNISNPLGIDNKTPDFSWQMDEKNYFPKNYRVMVATSEDLLNSNTPDMWDSGVVESNSTMNVKYEGKPLASSKIYFWKVFVDGVESEISNFETALFNPDYEFSKAYWIGQPFGFAGSVDDVRVDLNFTKNIVWCRFYVAMLGAGKVYLNGKAVDDGYFDGSVSPYDKEIYYRTYALDMKKGKNALCVKLGYGFYGAKKMIGILKFKLDNGKVYSFKTFPGRAWNVKRDAIRLNGIYDGEIYDAREEEDWLNPDYKVTFGNWVATFVAAAPKGKFKANPLPPMRIKDTFAPKTVYDWKGDTMVDTGVNLCGFLSFKVKGERGAKIVVNHAERLLPDGNLDNFNLRAAECRDTYILKGEGEESYTPEFTYHGFQYALIKKEGNVEITDIKVNYLRSDVEQCGEFECSDKMFNTLHKIAVQTEGNNLNGVFTDCPQRDERLGWLNDLTSRMYQSICNFSLEKFLGNFIDMITASQTEKGVIQDTIPYEVGCYTADPISAYITLGTLHYKFYADKKVLERNYKGFCKWLAFLQKNADDHDGTISFGYYGDWCPAKIYAKSEKKDTFSKTVPTKLVSAFYFLWYLRQMADIANVLGKKGDKETFEKKYKFYRKKFDSVYLNTKEDVYGTGGQTECAIAMTVFADEKERCVKWAKRAADDIVAHNYHMTCGNQGYRHLFYNLAEYGYTDVLVKLLKNEEYPGWGYMLKCGATSVWERWENSVGSDMHSFNHPMFSAYDGFFYNYLLGIRTMACDYAFKSIVINPCFATELSYAKGKLKTLRGDIVVDWKRVEDKIEIKVSTPANTKLKFVASGKTITYNGNNYRDFIELGNGDFNFVIS